MRAVTSWSTPRGSVARRDSRRAARPGSRRTASGRNAERDAPPDQLLDARQARAGDLVELDDVGDRSAPPVTPSGATTRGGDDVHRRRADELGDEQVDRVVVQLDRRAALHDPAVAHHRRPIAHRHRLDLIVGDVERRDPHELVEGDDLESQSRCAAWRRGSTSARPSAAGAACARSPAPSPPAAAGRRTAGRDSGRADRSAGAAARSRPPCVLI